MRQRSGFQHCVLPKWLPGNCRNTSHRMLIGSNCNVTRGLCPNSHSRWFFIAIRDKCSVVVFLNLLLCPFTKKKAKMVSVTTNISQNKLRLIYILWYFIVWLKERWSIRVVNCPGIGRIYSVFNTIPSVWWFFLLESPFL